jgi:hypothetical protein
MRPEDKRDRSNKDRGVESDSSRAKVTEEIKWNLVRDADGCPQDPNGVPRLTFGKLREIRIHAQELRNNFAHLLNQGSSLE